MNIMECFGFMLQTVLWEVPLSILFYQKLKEKHLQKLKSTLLHRFRQIDRTKAFLNCTLNSDFEGGSKVIYRKYSKH